ncbi:AraC family transcriptional regulator [Heyndrickxia coagulans]|uniref:AraC family transcriptional regulator n=1 Tax=Heyndrickxia coagulans TaxID=1398 RepID=UPI0002F6D0E0|nr:AraC family transcriptional regulator [Heyndrickxia coagulans]
MKQSAISKSIIERYLSYRVEHQREYFLHPPYMMEKQLLNAVKEGRVEAAESVLKTINTLERAKLAEEPIRSLRNSLICICTLFTRAAIEAGVPPETAFNISDAHILEIERLKTQEKLFELEYSMLRNFTEAVQQARKQEHRYSHAIHMAVAYIHENILQVITLESLAKHVYLNPSYLSHLFKKETGVSVTDYINKKRIEESIYFLLHTNIPISEIALLFHFCNQSYYTSLFKKYMGLTPKEFREQNQH